MSYTEPQGAPYTPGPVGEDPGKTLGIVGLVLSIVVCGPVGAIVSYLGLSKSKAAGFKNTSALIGLIWGLVGTVGLVLYLILGGAAILTQS
ncbi:MAG: hypothetical protein Q4G45_14205 [Actinomycetia bacterium]|nr:hypothetical protein [Actinomycetes bacterium]